MCLAAALLANGSFVAAVPLAGTTTFEPPVELTPAGSSPEFGQHAVTRFVDSLDLPRTYLYRHRNGTVHLARTEAALTRNDQGHITMPDNPCRAGFPARLPAIHGLGRPCYGVLLEPL